ncbi:uncharacterized protein N7459_005121 [Penicillium hispanicum]|uniref:uncharacterized protein n=1 Tax=Penicillium hispanicum TaxID=1080232 RepID=UPI00253FE494|nr:uncharacterized protein N7459_005121 [Penicillium hispanicum]KAJ5585321.1 hypothetical protein N7459_005121 [Penicillium hispanicum]
MAFLSCSSDLAPLFRLLDESHSRPTPVRTRTRTFSPAFDVRELNNGYYLDGELPGVDQSNIDIEFSDSHTLVVKGRTERDYKNESSGAAPARSRQPTVEDEDEDESDSNSTDTDTVHSTATPTQSSSGSQSPSFRYWVSERSIGEFQRTFTFPGRVDQDAVRASLKNGILSIFVPKEAAPKTKKIRIH